MTEIAGAYEMQEMTTLGRRWYDAEQADLEFASLRQQVEGLEHRVEQLLPAEANALAEEKDNLLTRVRFLEQQVAYTSIGAPWLSLAHMLCTDHGIPQGHITERLDELRHRLAAQPAAVADAIGCAIEIVRRARDSICAGGFAENRQHEESVVGPYLDGIEDELRELLTAPPAQARPAEGEPDIRWTVDGKPYGHPTKHDVLRWLSEHPELCGCQCPDCVLAYESRPAIPSDLEELALDCCDQVDQPDTDYVRYIFTPDDLKGFAAAVLAAPAAQEREKPE